jgi:hypothetical protein
MSDLLQKVIDTTIVGAGDGGLLNAEQATQFIDYMWDATALVKDARRHIMKSEVADIDKVGVGAKLVRLATEAIDDGVNASATFTKVSITTKKLRLDWELSSESLEDNIEGAALEDHIARLMATQFGNDVEDLSINGDVSLTADALYKSFDGWRKLAINNAHVIDAAGVPISRVIFNKLLKALPRKYKARRNMLKFYAGSQLVQDYLYSLQANTVEGYAGSLATGVITGAQAAPAGAGGGVSVSPFGVPLMEVPMFDETRAGTYPTPTGDHGDIELTFPQNRIVGIKREVIVHREFKPKKDSIEYTAYTRCGVQVENEDARVIAINVKVEE